MHDPEQTENAFVDFIAKEVARRSMTHSDFARAVWGESGVSVSRWRRLRSPKKQKKPQRLRFGDAARMASVLEMDFSSLVFRFERELELRDT